MAVYFFVLSVAALVYVLTIIILQKSTLKNQSTARRIDMIAKEVVEERHSEGKKNDPLQLITKFVNAKFLEKLSAELAMAGIPLRVEEYLVMWFLLSFGMMVVSASFGARTPVSLGIFILGGAVPIVLIKFKKEKRTVLFNRQLMDALGIICNCLKTGFSFQAAVESVAEEMEDPISSEFKRMLRETKLGLNIEESMEQMAKRMGNKDLQLIANAVLIQRQVGGNLAEILSNISNTIQERIKLHDEIKVLTSSGRTSGYVIGLLPVAILLILMLVNPSYMEKLFITSEGRKVLMVSAVLEIIGFAIVKKIVSVKY